MPISPEKISLKRKHSRIAWQRISEGVYHPHFVPAGNTVHRQTELLATNPHLREPERFGTFTDELLTIPPGTKWCYGCGYVRNRSMFSPDKRNLDGLHSKCKSCRNGEARMKYALLKGGQVRSYRVA